MPERLDRVTIAFPAGDVVVDWTTRDALMGRLQHVKTKVKLRDTFSSVGASRPVELSPVQKTTLLATLEEWLRDGSYEPMPETLTPLREALLADHTWRIANGLS
jgi:hypothetical protein